jgi:hypothetical protein
MQTALVYITIPGETIPIKNLTSSLTIKTAKRDVEIT